MKSPWKSTATTVVLTAALLASATPALAAADPKSAVVKPAVQAPLSYTLTQDLQVEIKTVVNEKTPDGTRLGAVVRIKNTGAKLVRVPEYEVRLKTKDGVEYKLQPSLGSPKSIQPKSQAELSYLTTVDSAGGVELGELTWVDIDVYVYPKKETPKLSIPITEVAWSGTDNAEIPSASVKKWGESFAIPSLDTPLEFKLSNISRNYEGNKASSIVQVLLTNPSKKREKLPDIVLEGKSGLKTYDSALVESGVALEPGEQKYVHFVIPTELNTELDAFNIVTTEKYINDQKEPVTYRVGRVHVLLPDKQSDALLIQGKYAFGEAMKMDPLNNLIHPDMSVSLVELHMEENEGDGFNTAIAKFRLTNKSSRPLGVPSFATDLVSSDGYTYSGSRQGQTSIRVLPNASYIVSYSYVLPASETGEELKLALYEAQGSASPEAKTPASAGGPDKDGKDASASDAAAGASLKGAVSFKSLLTAYKVDVQPQPESKDLFALYPLNVKVNLWDISAIYNLQQGYNYRLKLMLDIKQEKDVLIDRTFSQLQFDMYDSGGTLISSISHPFFGQNKLQNGTNILNFSPNTEELGYPITIKVYEAFENDKGETVKRLLGSFKQ
ncbi:hypothetical protein [Paenibacillus lutrae]|uniref:DUF4352 domain-containing protein n=1 Tax=Paenibacillus lutrae TaxID=2078573 RepID=A0A7X3JYW3_9BACL|nr:hypothetical protein [Paenibacillus lutrae]MVO99330.1 hypothetical protein [Paenibacillus lutrae]